MMKLFHEIKGRGDIHIYKVHTNDNVADPLTKALSQQKHESHTSSIGIRYMNDCLKCKWEIVSVGALEAIH